MAQVDCTAYMKKTEDIKWLDLAIESSLMSVSLSSPNPPVGAVIVNDGGLIASGHTQEPGNDHAEIVAIKKAGDMCAGSTLYATLEPCSFQGRTPPCTDSIVASKIKRVVIGHVDHNPSVSGKGIKKLESAGIQVTLLNERKKEIRALLNPFFQSLGVFSPENIKPRPEYMMKAAITLDGFLATAKKSSKWISHDFSRLLVHRLRALSDAVLVGRQTARLDDPDLTVRLICDEDKIFKSIFYAGSIPDSDIFSRYILTCKEKINHKRPKPYRVVLDSSLNLSKKSKLALTAGEYPTIVIYNKKKETGLKRKIKILKGLGIELFPAGARGKFLDFDDINSILLSKGITRVLVEGGSQIHKSFFDNGLYDRFYIFLAGKLLGGSNGLSLFSGKGILNMERAFVIPNQKALVLPNLDDDKSLNVLFTGVKNHVYGIG